MGDENSNLLKLLKVRLFNVREAGICLDKSKPLALRTINNVREDIHYVETLLDINGINIKNNPDYLLLKEELLRGITAYRSGVDLIFERAKKEKNKEEGNYLQKIRELG